MSDYKRIPTTEDEFRDSIKNCFCCRPEVCDDLWHVDIRSVLLDLFFEIQDLRNELALIKGEQKWLKHQEVLKRQGTN